MITLKKVVNKFLWIFNQFGIDLLKFMAATLGFVFYLRDFVAYKLNGIEKGIPVTFKPCLTDRFSFAANLDFEYFYQDLYVSKLIYSRRPVIHYDIGSRVDGFVSQVSIFTKVLVFDIRPLDIEVPNIDFKQMDLSTNEISSELEDSTSSLSCLHTLEHLGLGRYGDPIINTALINFVKNLSKMLKNSGILYVSFPIGRRRVEFNANNIFNIQEMNLLFKEFNLAPLKFYLYNNRSIADRSDLIVGSEIYFEETSDSLAILELIKVTQ